MITIIITLKDADNDVSFELDTKESKDCSKEELVFADYIRGVIQMGLNTLESIDKV